MATLMRRLSIGLLIKYDRWLWLNCKDNIIMLLHYHWAQHKIRNTVHFGWILGKCRFVLNIITRLTLIRNNFHHSIQKRQPSKLIQLNTHLQSRISPQALARVIFKTIQIRNHVQSPKWIFYFRHESPYWPSKCIRYSRCGFESNTSKLVDHSKKINVDFLFICLATSWFLVWNRIQR